MYYYQHHIGDFRSGTSNMDRHERWLYRDMIDVYYDKEAPLPIEVIEVCDAIGAKETELDMVARILRLKFIKTESGWMHQRCEEELVKYRGIVASASTAGKASAVARAAKRAALGIVEMRDDKDGNGGIAPVERRSTDRSTPVEQSFTDRSTEFNGQATNQEPTTNNHKPDKVKNNAPACADAVLFPGVSERVIADFKALRKTKKAPITLTAMEGIAKEAEKAGINLESAMELCCTRGWTGFKADWVLARAQPAASARPAAPSRHSGFDQLDYNEGIENGRIV